VEKDQRRGEREAHRGWKLLRGNGCAAKFKKVEKKRKKIPPKTVGFFPTRSELVWGQRKTQPKWDGNLPNPSRKQCPKPSEKKCPTTPKKSNQKTQEVNPMERSKRSREETVGGGSNKGRWISFTTKRLHGVKGRIVMGHAERVVKQKKKSPVLEAWGELCKRTVVEGF